MEERAEKVIELIARGSTDGEKAAARAALSRMIKGEKGPLPWIICGRAMLRTGRLNPRETKFVGEMIDSFLQGLRVSKKQMDWFGRIYKRVIGWERGG